MMLQGTSGDDDDWSVNSNDDTMRYDNEVGGYIVPTSRSSVSVYSAQRFVRQWSRCLQGARIAEHNTIERHRTNNMAPGDDYNSHYRVREYLLYESIWLWVRLNLLIMLICMYQLSLAAVAGSDLICSLSPSHASHRIASYRIASHRIVSHSFYSLQILCIKSNHVCSHLSQTSVCTTVCLLVRAHLC
jgi:hypothetical protein